jgi:DNA polymerase-4
MDALTMLTPDVEVFSVDEAFLDITNCQRLLGPPEKIANMVKQTVLEASGGVLCSIGVSGDKTTAKYAAKLNKPNGLTIIPPWEANTALSNAPVTDLCGIARGIGKFLADRDVHTCGDMQKLPIGELGKRFGNLGRRIWLMAQGLDPDPVKTSVPAPKSIGHGKVMPPDTTDINTIQTFLLHMSEKVAARLRRHQFRASRFFIGLRSAEGWISGKYRPALPTDHGPDIMDLCRRFISQEWRGEAVFQVQVTALDPHHDEMQMEMFAPDRGRMQRLNRARDHINQRYGEFALAPARLLLRSNMPNVIAPAWKPSGHRETIL